MKLLNRLAFIPPIWLAPSVNAMAVRWANTNGVYLWDMRPAGSWRPGTLWLTLGLGSNVAPRQGNLDPLNPIERRVWDFRNGKYWMDDKPAKQTARKMLQMMFDINKANFGGQPVVTCNTCHRGSTKPIPVPAIGQGDFANTTRADDEAKVLEPMPTADQVFDKYTQALGGKAAVDKIKTRTTKATLLRPKVINSGAAGAAVLNRAESWTIETFQKAPNKYLAVITIGS